MSKVARFRMASGFQWTATRSAVAVGLAKGRTQTDLAQEYGLTDRTIRNWLQEAEFSEEVDRLSHMVGMAGRAARLRLANRVIEEMISERIDTDKDLLDWLKFIQSETDGIKIGVAETFLEASAFVAGSRQASVDSGDSPDPESTVI